MLPFLIDVQGEYRRGRLHVLWRDVPPPVHPELDALIAETWARECERHRRAGGMLFNGQLARYLSHACGPDGLTLEVGPTDYASFLGTNLYNPHRAEEFGWACFSNPIGTSGTPITSDGWLLLGRRSERVAFHAGFYHTFGGGLEAADRRDDGTLDAFGSILRELREELAVHESEVADLVCLGLIRDPAIRQPELIFDVFIRLTRAQVAERLNLDDAHQEHTAMVACRDDVEAMRAFIRDHQPITPVAQGALHLHARRRWGAELFTS